MQQGCVDDAIDGGGGSGAEGHGGDGNDGKPRRPQEHAERIADIEKEILSERKTPLGAGISWQVLGLDFKEARDWRALFEHV
jgi:hypothetical protein